MPTASRLIYTPVASIATGVYATNTQWDQSTRAIIRQHQQTNRSPDTLRSFMDDIASDYFMLDYLNHHGHGLSQRLFDVGQRRTPGDQRFDTTRLLQIPYTHYPAYLNRVNTLASQNAQQHWITSDGKLLALTRYASTQDGGPVLQHTSVALFPALDAEAERVCQQFRDAKTPMAQQASLGRLFWLLCNWMPYRRGSAAISDMTWRSLALQKGLQPTAWPPGIVPDLEALTLPVDDFVPLFQQWVFANAPKQLGRVYG